jgi:ATP-dependent Lhr-like helicase
MALALQEGGIGRAEWFSWVEAVPAFRALPLGEIAALVTWMLDCEILWEEAGILWLGREGQDTYGRKNFLELFSVFTAPPEVTVLHGKQELGFVHDTTFLARQDAGPVVLLLAGRSWRLTHLDWKRRQAYVVPFEEGGRSRWQGQGQLLSLDLCRSIREVLADPGEDARWSRRARQRVAEVRLDYPWIGTDHSSVVLRRDGEVHWVTFAGGRANAALAPWVARELGCRASWDNFAIRLQGELKAEAVQACLRAVQLASNEELVPAVSAEAVEGLKFAECLSPGVAAATVGARLSDPVGVVKVRAEPVQMVVEE